MKSIKVSVFTVSLFLICSVYAGQGFQGLEFSAGIESGMYKSSGAEVFNAGVDQGYATQDANQKKSGSIFGISYGFGARNFITTLGIDYSSSNENLSTSMQGVPTSTPGPITQVYQNRYELSLAPGYKLTRSTLAYVKLGILDLPHKTPIDTNQNATPLALTGGPGALGAEWGIGIKQKMSANSRYFIKLDYSAGLTKNGQTIDSNGFAYSSRASFSSGSASLGYCF